MPAPDPRGAAPTNQRRHSAVAPTPTILPSTAHLPSATTATSSTSAPAAAQQDALSVILVTGGYDNTIRFWEAWSGVCSRTLNHQEHVSFARLLFTCGGLLHPDIVIRLQQVNRLAISPDKRFLAAAGNGTVKLYDIATSAAGSGGANVGPVSDDCTRPLCRRRMIAHHNLCSWLLLRVILRTLHA